jgi:nicotinamide riboside kinase
MLIAVSGSQGSGKSTVISKLEQTNHKIVNVKVARSVLTEWGMSLEEIYRDVDLTMKFQDAILEAKKESELTAKFAPEIYFTERSYADLFTYSLIYLGKENRCSEWLNNYHFKCLVAQQTYDLVFYLRAGKFQVTHDGVRGSNQHYSRMADQVMLDVTQQMSPLCNIVVETADLEARVATISQISRITHLKKGSR